MDNSAYDERPHYHHLTIAANPPYRPPTTECSRHTEKIIGLPKFVPHVQSCPPTPPRLDNSLLAKPPTTKPIPRPRFKNQKRIPELTASSAALPSLSISLTMPPHVAEYPPAKNPYTIKNNVRSTIPADCVLAKTPQNIIGRQDPTADNIVTVETVIERPG
jgi:hypothetical protein